jgi:hypothetical protein
LLDEIQSEALALCMGVEAFVELEDVALVEGEVYAQTVVGHFQNDVVGSCRCVDFDDGYTAGISVLYGVAQEIIQDAVDIGFDGDDFFAQDVGLQLYLVLYQECIERLGDESKLLLERYGFEEGELVVAYIHELVEIAYDRFQ